MLRLYQNGLLLMLMIISGISCKKDFRSEPATNSPTIQVLKDWYSSNSYPNFSKRYLNTTDTIPANGKPGWEVIKQVKGISLAPVILNTTSTTTKQQITKYLVINTNVAGKPENGYYLYVINEGDSSSITMQVIADYTKGIIPANFKGALIRYDLSNKYLGSHNVTPDQKDNLVVREATTNVVSNLAPLPDGCSYVQVDWYWQHFENGVLIYEIYLYSSREIDCGEGGGGGGYHTDSLPKHKPCPGADSLANNTEFKSLFQNLQSKTIDSSEYGYLYTQTSDPNTVNETSLAGTNGYLDLFNALPSSTVDGFLHSHFHIPGRSLSIFSDYDIQYLAYLGINNLIRDPDTFSGGLVTADGTQYLLRIDDPLKFQNFAKKAFSVIAPLIWQNYGISVTANNTAAANEKGFLDFLNRYDCGLTLFRGNNTFTSWQPLKISQNTVVVTSCN